MAEPPVNPGPLWARIRMLYEMTNSDVVRTVLDLVSQDIHTLLKAQDELHQDHGQTGDHAGDADGSVPDLEQPPHVD